MNNRQLKREVKVGPYILGGNNPIRIQSMCNTKTKQVASTINQILALEKAGCEIIRVAVLDMEDALAIKEIKKNIHIPLVADIHFDYRLALQALDSGIDKLRINPGNIGNIDRITKVVNKCKEKHVPIRIGVNLGSLDKSVEAIYGRCAKALVYSAKKHVDILESLDFHDIVISMKASNVQMTIEAYELANEMFDYPLHIGVTEAGTAKAGTIRSSVGLGVLINEGIGDTLRVSLSDDPLKEVIVAKEILASFGLYKKPLLTSCPTCGRTQYNMFPILYEIEDFLETVPQCDIHVAIMGCIVNGPGEAKDADIGIAGGIGEALLFKHGEIIRKIPESQIVSELKREILLMIEEKNALTKKDN